jgi:hypothetical protein
MPTTYNPINAAPATTAPINPPAPILSAALVDCADALLAEVVVAAALDEEVVVAAPPEAPETLPVDVLAGLVIDIDRPRELQSFCAIAWVAAVGDSLLAAKENVIREGDILATSAGEQTCCTLFAMLWRKGWEVQMHFRSIREQPELTMPVVAGPCCDLGD